MLNTFAVHCASLNICNSSQNINKKNSLKILKANMYVIVFSIEINIKNALQVLNICTNSKDLL